MSKSNDNNRIKRLKIIDEMLSHTESGVTMVRLIQKVREQSARHVDRFSISRDLNFLSSELGLDILEESRQVNDMKNSQCRNVKIYRYRDSKTSLFTIDLND